VAITGTHKDLTSRDMASTAMHHPVVLAVQAQDQTMHRLTLPTLIVGALLPRQVNLATTPHGAREPGVATSEAGALAHSTLLVGE